MIKPIVRKRKILKKDGLQYPCLPSVEEVNKNLSQIIVESLKSDSLTQPKEYDLEAKEILEQGKIYIGIYEFSYLIFFESTFF